MGNQEFPVNGVMVSVSDLMYYINRHMYAAARAFLVHKTNCSEAEASAIVKELMPQDVIQPRRPVNHSASGRDVLSCPRCGSISITTGRRGVTFTTGLLGASKTVNRCANCGYSWKPSIWTAKK